DRAAFRTAAEERALRPAQHLDPFEIEQRRHGRAVLRRKAARGAFLQRRFVEIKARGCGRRTLLANAANGYRRIAGRLAARQSEPGYQRLQIRDGQNALLIEGGLGLRGYGDRDAIDRIAAPSSRDDHFFRRLFLGKRRRLHCKQGGARSYYAATRL